MMLVQFTDAAARSIMSLPTEPRQVVTQAVATAGKAVLVDNSPRHCTNEFRLSSGLLRVVVCRVGNVVIVADVLWEMSLAGVRLKTILVS